MKIKGVWSHAPQLKQLMIARRVGARRKREHDRRETRSAAASLAGDRASISCRRGRRAPPARDLMKRWSE